MTVESSPPPAASRPWRLAGALAGVLLAIALWRLATSNAPPTEPGTPGLVTLVTIEQQQPDSPPIVRDVSLGQGATVFDATQAAGRDGGPKWASVWRGSGEMALLESLGGISSAGAAGGPEGLNWQFEVNGVYATRGAGAVRLESGDRVLWKLAPYE